LSSSIWRCRLAAFSSCSCSRADVRSSCHKSQTRPSRKVCDSVRGRRVGSGGAARGGSSDGAAAARRLVRGHVLARAGGREKEGTEAYRRGAL
jgi:hypothetical protein